MEGRRGSSLVPGSRTAPQIPKSKAAQVHGQLSLHWWFCILEFNHLRIGFHCSIYWKKSMYKWILAQTHVVQRNNSHTC